VLQPFKWELSQCGQVRATLEQIKQRAEHSIPQPRTESETVVQKSDAYS
jgi:hypothetical protein